MDFQTFSHNVNPQVCDHFAGDFQPELRTLQEQSWRQGEISLHFIFFKATNLSSFFVR